MKINVLAFGITRDIVGGASCIVELPEEATVGDLLTHLKATYPGFTKLQSLAVAVNTEYAENEHSIQPQDEVVLIPPVAGG